MEARRVYVNRATYQPKVLRQRIVIDARAVAFGDPIPDIECRIVDPETGRDYTDDVQDLYDVRFAS